MSATSHPLGDSSASVLASGMSSVEQASAQGNSQLVSTSAAKRSATIPGDVVRLDVLLTSGQRKFFDFDPTTSIRNVRDTIWSDWPQDWPSRPASSSAIRILHLGHILDDKAVLSPATTAADSNGSAVTVARTMPVGRITVVHLLVRQSPARKGSGTDEEPLKKRRQDNDVQPGCCGCTIV